MTNSIGAGLTNVSLPLPDTEARMAGRLAFRLNKSRVQLYRDLALEGARILFPDFAREMERVRLEHKALKAEAEAALREDRQQYFRFFRGIMCLFAGGLAMLGTLLTGDDELRRTRGVRVRSSWARRVEV